MIGNSIASSSTKHFSSDYSAWMERLSRVLNAYHAHQGEGFPLEAFQLFLLQTGQFNASFTQEELKRLEYPLSPFAMMHRHTYLRATDTWAMEILRAIYIEQHQQSKLFPMWVDSERFWRELTRYCRVVDSENEEWLSTVVDELIHEKRLKDDLWIRLQGSAAQCQQRKKEIEKTVRDRLTTRVIESTCGDVLIPVFKALAQGVSVKNLTTTAEILKALDECFPKVKKEHLQNEKERHNVLQFPAGIMPNTNAWTDWLKKAFGVLKANQHQAVQQMRSPEAFQELFNKNKDEFEEILNGAHAQFKPKDLTIKQYAESIQKWLSENIELLLKEFSKQSVCCFKDTLNVDNTAETMIDAVVFCDHVPDFVKSVMGNLGYRLDPVRAIRMVLKKFPQLFIDHAQTKAFWGKLMNASMSAALLEKEKTVLDWESVEKEMISRKPTPEGSAVQRRSKEFSVLNQLNSLVHIVPKLKENFKIYGEYIAHFLLNYVEMSNQSYLLCSVADEEIQTGVQMFLDACGKNDFAKAVRATQVISETMLLFFEFYPMPQFRLFPEAIKNDLKDYPVQAVLTTAYAMKSFVRIFQILEGQYARNAPPKIAATNHSYFEWLHNLESLHSSNGVLTHIKHVEDMDPSTDIIFAELHPNNVVETHQFSHPIDALLSKMGTWAKKPRTLVLDVTLNSLNDPEIHQLLAIAHPLIKNGLLNLILIQSLTKLAQIGLDQRSSGAVIVINNRAPHWSIVNRNVQRLSQIEPIDPSTLSFFSYFAYFAQLKDLGLRYVQQMNRNVRFTYEKIVEQLNALEVLTCNHFQITLNSDPKACYVALNMKGLLPEADPGFSLNTSDIAAVAEDIAEYLLFPLCALYKLPMTERTTIGLPLSSVNCVQDSFRITIGLESEAQLQQYADIVAFIAFVLNRQRNVKLFFDEIQRRAYFQEKVNQFHAMTPGMRFESEIQITSETYPHSVTDAFRQKLQLRLQLQMRNGVCHLLREALANNGRNTEWHVYPQERIGASIRGKGVLSLSHPHISIAERRMTVACLTEQSEQNVKLLFNNSNHTVTFSSMEIVNSWNVANRYGPFWVNATPIYFHLNQKEISLEINGKFYPQTAIVVKQGHIETPLTDMPIEEQEFLIRAGGYAMSHEISAQRERVLSFQPQPNVMRLFIKNNKLMIEHDVVCCETNGATIYKRFLGKNLTCYKIDFWGEKDPTLARLMQLMTAIYVKEKKNVSFIARNGEYSHFLFRLSYGEEGDEIFAQALQQVMAQKDLLHALLKEHHGKNSREQYSFQTSSDLARGFSLQWPHGIASGKTETVNKPLIEEAIRLLNCRPVVLPQLVAPIQLQDNQGYFPSRGPGQRVAAQPVHVGGLSHRGNVPTHGFRYSRS